MKKTLKDIIAAMTPEEYKLTVGTYSEEPLKYAFEKKRVVHPGVQGRPLSPTERHAAWKKVMQKPAQKDVKRTAYIHIPFCSNICLYCGFFQNYSNEERETLYIDHLITELKMTQADSYINGGLFHAVFIGGGTPSALSPYNAERLLQAIHQYLPLANDCELTMEARIHDLAEDKMEAWFANGVNRVSVGVQSFDTNIRKTMGRLDSREVVLERLHKLASYNQASIIIDLIYGLPGQSIESLLDDLATVDTLPIEGMDLYQLNLFEVSPLKKAIDAGSIPSAAATAQQAMMFATANEWLSERAYTRLSNCHWAKGNRERNMYNLLTKQGTEVFPFGAGAGGNIGEYRIFLQRELKVYIENITKSEKPIMFMGNQSNFQNLHNDMLRQLEQGYFNIEFLAAKYGDEIRQLDYLLTIWQKNGLVKRGKILTRLTAAGQFWHMNIAQSLLECAERILEQDVKIEVQRIAEQG
jgi:oxygen-independent coproporphyrinogen-3 oxidase